MTSVSLPARNPSPRARRLTAVGAVIGALLIAGCLVSYLFANFSSAKVDKHDPYPWRSGSAIYLASSDYDPISCTVSPDNGPARTVHIPGDAPKWFYLNRLTVSSGPVLWLYPLAYTPIVPMVAIALVAIWWNWSRQRKPRQTRPDPLLGLAAMMTRRRRR
jgi:hypothetical protein